MIELMLKGERLVHLHYPPTSVVAEVLSITNSEEKREIEIQIQKVASQTQWHTAVMGVGLEDLYRFFKLQKSDSIAYAQKLLVPIKKISRRDAYRIYSGLPYPENNGEFEHRQQYLIGGFWLIAREYDLSYILQYLEIKGKSFKKLANALEQRYLLCRGLIEHGAFKPSFTPAGIWLLWQYQNSLAQVQNSQKSGSKSRSRKHRKGQLELLHKAVQESILIIEEHSDTNQALSSQIELAAVRQAQNSKDFDKEYFSPWRRAEQTWNNESRSAALQGLCLPSKRGPTL